MSRNILLILGVILLVGSATFTYFYFFEDSDDDEGEVVIIPAVIEIVEYGDDGFSPESIVVEEETSVEFTNSSNRVLRIEFVEYPELGMADIEPGDSSSSLPLDEAGIYEYRNSQNPSHVGRIEVR